MAQLLLKRVKEKGNGPFSTPVIITSSHCTDKPKADGALILCHPLPFPPPPTPPAFFIKEALYGYFNYLHLNGKERSRNKDETSQLGTSHTNRRNLRFLRLPYRELTHPLCSGLDLFLYECRETLREPFFAPVLRANKQTKPGMRDLVSQTYSHACIFGEKGLGEKCQVGAVISQRENDKVIK